MLSGSSQGENKNVPSKSVYVLYAAVDKVYSNVTRVWVVMQPETL